MFASLAILWLSLLIGFMLTIPIAITIWQSGPVSSLIEGVATGIAVLCFIIAILAFRDWKQNDAVPRFLRARDNLYEAYDDSTAWGRVLEADDHTLPSRLADEAMRKKWEELRSVTDEHSELSEEFDQARATLLRHHAYFLEFQFVKDNPEIYRNPVEVGNNMDSSESKATGTDL